MQLPVGASATPDASAAPDPPAPGALPDLSVTITAFNESARLPVSLEHVLPFLDAQPFAYEVVINDDGSQDSTADVVREFSRRFPGRVRLVQAPANEGKGAGLRRAILASRGRWVLFSDADFSTPVEELPRLLATLEQGYDVVIGSRLQPDGTDMRQSQPVYRRLFGKLFHRLADPLVVRGIGDTQSGFKVFCGDVARELFRDTCLSSIIFDVEVLYLAQHRGYRIAEVPVQWTNAGGSRMRVTARHALRVFWDLLRIPWLHRDEWLAAGRRPARLSARRSSAATGRPHRRERASKPPAPAVREPADSVH
jgi:dolichyl-phosphate beta-glucosyltransferase